MATIQSLPKNLRQGFTPEQINAMITRFKAMFPDDVQLAGTPNTQIANSVTPFLVSNQKYQAIAAPESVAASLTTSTSCAVAIATVIVDVVLVFFSFAGLDVPGEGAITREVAGEVAEMVDVSLPAWQQLVSNLKNATSITDQAKAIWAILSRAYTVGMFGTICKAIKKAVHWYDWVIAGVTALAQISALVLTDGAAFVAELILASTTVASLVEAAVQANSTCSS